jgi:hypothetical protein
MPSGRAARSLGLDQAIARLQKISGAAVSALLKVMFDPGSPPAAQLKAAETGGKPPEGSMRQSIYRELEKLGSSAAGSGMREWRAMAGPERERTCACSCLPIR